MERGILGAVALMFTAQGAVMLAAPLWWYGAVPGVALTGPFNGHFVFDIGLIFAVSALAILGGAWRGDAGLCLAGLGWPLAHALYHLWLTVTQANCAEGELAANLAGIQAPVWIGLLAVAAMLKRKGPNQ